MKKKILTNFLILILLIVVSGCSGENNKHEEDIPLTKEPADIVFTISKKQNDCIPVEITVYKDGTYELFTAYETCKEDEVCASMLKYTKSTKGKYDFDVMKIIDNSKNTNDMIDINDNLIDYEIYMGSSYIEEGYNNLYIIEKEQTNKYLDEFLKEINVNLNKCAQPEQIAE